MFQGIEQTEKPQGNFKSRFELSISDEIEALRDFRVSFRVKSGTPGSEGTQTGYEVPAIGFN